MLLKPALILSSLVLATGCANVPELDAKVTPELRKAPFPTMQEIGPILEESESFIVDETIGAALRARADSLQGRAANMR